MAFVDEITLHLRSGKGGDGIVSWLHMKGLDHAGPAGGDGGRGGDVYVRGVRDYAILAKYRNMKDFSAENGETGHSKNMFGRNGKDLVLDVPIGTVVKNLATERTVQVLEEGELVFLLKGGKGGYGNNHFKASTNVQPQEFTLGKVGEEADIYLELQLLVDLGFVGFPNAGKSSLLNVLTNATAKVASYQFTTLEPNLGDLHGYILADIPGLIEGASAGKGLGFKFLRHVNRTKAILHFVSLENEDISAAYHTVRKELETFSSELASKPEILLLTKTDIVTPDILKKKIAEAKKLNKKVYTISAYDLDAIKKLKDDLVKMLRAFDVEAKVAKKGQKEEKGKVRFETDSMPTTFLEERAQRAVKKLGKKK